MKMSKIVIGNQKMYMDKEEVLTFVETLKNTNMNNKQVIVCPTYPFLEYYNGVVLWNTQIRLLRTLKAMILRCYYLEKAFWGFRKHNRVVCKVGQIYFWPQI